MQRRGFGVVEIDRRATGRVVTGQKRRKSVDLIGMIHLAPVPLYLLQGDHVGAGDGPGGAFQIDAAITALAPLDVAGNDAHHGRVVLAVTCPVPMSASVIKTLRCRSIKIRRRLSQIEDIHDIRATAFGGNRNCLDDRPRADRQPGPCRKSVSARQ